MSKREWILCGEAVFLTLFWAFCLLCLIDMCFSLRTGKARREAFERGVPYSLSPSNLDGAPESLRLGLNAELDGSPGEEMAKTKAWQRLQATASEYARRLEFVEEQYELMRERDSKRSLWMVFVYGGSMLAGTVLMIVGRRNKRGGTPQEGRIMQPRTDSI